MQQSVQVLKQDEYRIAPTFQPSVTESCANRYKMVIRPLSFTKERASYSWRSPSVGCLMSPNAFIEMDFQVETPGKWDYSAAVGPIVGQQLFMPQHVEAADETFNIAPRPKLCFGSQDSVGGAIDNIQITVNGSSISNARLKDYKWCLDSMWYEPDLFQKRFGTAGGCPQMYDVRCVSGEGYFRSSAYDALSTHAGQLEAAGTFVRADRGGNIRAGSSAETTPAVCAFTGDSGLQRRTEGILGCVYDRTAYEDNAQVDGVERAHQTDSFKVRVRWALNGAGGLFSPVCPQDKLSVSCPYRNSCLAIPHANSIAIDILFSDLIESVFKNLSTRMHGADQNRFLAGAKSGGIKVTLLGDGVGSSSPRLLVEYLRLQSYKTIPASVNLQVYRCSVHNATEKVPSAGVVTIAAGQDAAAVVRSGVTQLANSLPCMGIDRFGGERTAAPNAVTLTCRWDGIVAAQPCNYLLFCLQKSSKQYCGVGGLADNKDAITRPVVDWNYTRGNASGLGATSGIKAGLMNYFLSRNTMASCAIKTFELEVMSSLGAYTIAGDTAPFLRTRSELYRDHIRYAPEKYCDQQTWYKHKCCMMVGVDQYARGLATNGSAFPISYKATVVFECARQFITGEGACSIGARGPSVQRDMIHGEPVMVQVFSNSSLQISPSASLLSSQNLSHSQSQEILARS